MNSINAKLEVIRKKRNLSRKELAKRIGVSEQTIFNIERDPAYNYGVDLLKRLEIALVVAIEITIKEHEMNQTINISSAHLIHHFRENNPASQIGNLELGRKISDKMRENGVDPYDWDVKVIWPVKKPEVSEFCLPKTSAKYKIPVSLLPDLYTFLESIH